MNNSLYSILRYSDEPCQTLDDYQVHDILTQSPIDFLSHIYMGIDSIAHGKTTQICPGKTIFDDKDNSGDFRLMPCVLDFGNGLIKKTVKIVGTNHKQTIVKDKITVGKALVIHPTDNYVTHIIDACALSSARTGALATIAVDRLTTHYSKISIFGAGRVGFYSAFYLCSLFEKETPSIKEMRIWDVKKDRAESLVQYLASKFPTIKFVCSDDVSDIDVAVLATDSKTSFFSPYTTSARTVVSVGADEVNHRELSAAWASDANIYVESFDSIRYGDLNAWKKDKYIDNEDIYTIEERLRGFKPRNNRSRNVFISTGSGVYDNLTVGYILNGQY